MNDIQSVGKDFDLNLFLEARMLTKKAVDTVFQRVEMGMSEKDGLKLIDAVLDEMGAEKKWHPSKFRIGQNTVKSFREDSEPNITLRSTDIFFIDIGPVWNGHEGDYGMTFYLGEQTKIKQLAKTSQDIFNQVEYEWSRKKISGKELYTFAGHLAVEKGYRLNPKMKGHRLGDFPHHLHFRGGLNEVEGIPCNFLWVLEIHIIDSHNALGSFFEDVLMIQ